MAYVRSQRWLLLHDHFGSDLRPVVKIDHIRIDQPETARRHRRTDGLRLVGAVDAIDRAAEIERARAERIGGATCHPARQIRLPVDHLRWRRPVRPLLLARDLQKALPLETL